MKCEQCRYFSNNGVCCFGRDIYEIEDCNSFKDIYEVQEIVPKTIIEKPLTIAPKPEYKPSRTPFVESYGVYDTIDTHMETLKSTGKINGKVIPKELYEAWRNLLWYKLLSSKEESVRREYTSQQVFSFILDGKESLVGDNEKKLLNILKK